MRLEEMSVPPLAYLGDSVLELLVREHLVQKGLAKSAQLNRAALAFVSAPAQAGAMERILPHLNEEETAYFRRGRNLSHANVPRCATPDQYRAATGMEVLFAYLHLSEQRERMQQIGRAHV